MISKFYKKNLEFITTLNKYKQILIFKTTSLFIYNCCLVYGQLLFNRVPPIFINNGSITIVNNQLSIVNI